MRIAHELHNSVEPLMEETDQQDAAEDRAKSQAISAASGDSWLKKGEETEEGSFHERTMMNEQAIEPSVDPSVQSVDVLCGRGKPSFNHGKKINIG